MEHTHSKTEVLAVEKALQPNLEVPMKQLVFALMLLPMSAWPNQSDMNYLLDYDARIHVLYVDGDEGSGSGVYISNDVILTAAHLANVEGSTFFIDDKHTIEATILKIE